MCVEENEWRLTLSIRPSHLLSLVCIRWFSAGISMFTGNEWHSHPQHQTLRALLWLFCIRWFNAGISMFTGNEWHSHPQHQTLRALLWLVCIRWFSAISVFTEDDWLLTLSIRLSCLLSSVCLAQELVCLHKMMTLTFSNKPSGPLSLVCILLFSAGIGVFTGYLFCCLVQELECLHEMHTVVSAGTGVFTAYVYCCLVQELECLHEMHTVV